jgi:quercetin dioxygenase-like cupin family protein
VKDLPETCRELAALYSLDALDPGEASEFEAHLSRCRECSDEVRVLRETAARVLARSVTTDPPESLRDRVLSRIKKESGGALVRREEGEWREIGVAGVRVKQLFKDPVSGTLTSLVRMDAGSSYPRHVHARLEHLFVLEGDLVFEDHTLLAGDYEAAAGGTEHCSATTRGGCMVLTFSNLADEMLA